MNESFFKTVEKRRSIRSFSNKHVEKSKIQKILKIIWLGPSAKGLQNYRVYVIKDIKKKESLVQATYERIRQFRSSSSFLCRS